MQTLFLPAARSTPSAARTRPSLCYYYPYRLRPPLSFCRSSGLTLSPSNSLHSLLHSSSSSSSFSSSHSLPNAQRRIPAFPPIASSPAVSTGFSSPNDDSSDQAKLAQVANRLESTARYFKRLGSFGFWGQLVCTIVAAVILSFSIVVTGKITSPFTFYSTAAGIAAAFISVFWSFGYLRLSEKLRRSANEPSKAPSRADVVKSLKNSIVVNLLGMGAAMLGMQATVGLLIAKALTSSANPYYMGVSPGNSPVLALDVFLVQASANTLLSHFLGLVSSLELLRSVTLPPQPIAVPKVA
ncbi:Protein TIC 21, chloroplastic [Ancistrocladus abbreviatus]